MKDNITFEELKRNFESRIQKSRDKETLLKREIVGYTSIFDETILPLKELKDNCLLEEYLIYYTDKQINLIREFYLHFIVEPNDESEFEKVEWHSWVNNLSEFALDDLSGPTDLKYYYNLAKDIFEYLKWLRKFTIKSNQNLEIIIDRDNTIIDRLILEMIFKKYGHIYDGETVEKWLARFNLDTIEIEPIRVEDQARTGTARLKLIAILASVQNATGNSFDYEKFVETHFGIRNFQSTKTKCKFRVGYQEDLTECQKIIKQMI